MNYAKHKIMSQLTLDNMPDSKKMLALSWKQPFGTAMLHGKIETRTWKTNYRGWVLICTSKAAYNHEVVKNICGESLFIQMCFAMKANSGTLDLDGYAIAVGRLVDCRRMKLEDEAKAFVRFREDLYCHIYEDVHPIKPFPWKGAQGWKKVDSNLVEVILNNL